MRTTPGRRRTAVCALTLGVLTAGCGEFVREQGRSPSQLVIYSLQAAPGATPDELGGTLLSDVITNRTQPEPCSATSPCPTVYNDVGEVTMGLVLKDPGTAGVPNAPSALNQVTINRYRVVYRRADGRNTPGVDVPYPFDSALTVTVPADGTVTAGFQIVRHAAKEEAPLKALATTNNIISTIAEVTFYGRDQAGNDVAAAGQIGIDFGNFADPN